MAEKREAKSLYPTQACSNIGMFAMLKREKFSKVISKLPLPSQLFYYFMDKNSYQIPNTKLFLPSKELPSFKRTANMVMFERTCDLASVSQGWFLLLLSFFFVIQPVQAQSGKNGLGIIKGAVIDSVSKKAVREASVSLFTFKDSTFVTYTITGGEGNFLFSKLPYGQYRVLITYIGYKNISRQVSITQEAPQADLGNLEMVQTSIELGEVTIVQERPPITVKSDTVEFNAGSFKTQPNAQVEELLKKLPGIEISRDGTIRAQGEEVKRVLVDGKPFFGDDPKVATRNLPAEIIENIQVFNQQSDQSSFSGFDDGTREKTINLTTKKDKRKGIFGQNSLGAGTQDRYQAKLNLNQFNDDQQVSIVGQANNINQQGFTIQDMFNFGSAINGVSSGNTGSEGNGMMSGPILVMPGRGGVGGVTSGNTANNITEVWAGGVNFRDSWGKKVDINGSYFINRSDVATRQNSLRQNILPDTSFSNQGENQSDNLSTSHRMNLRLDYRLDSLNSIRLTPSVTFQHTNFNSLSNTQAFTGSDIPLNASTTQNTSAGDGTYGTNNLLYMRKFNKQGRTFSLSLTTVLNKGQSNGLNRSDNLFYNLPGEEPEERSFNQQTAQKSAALSHTINLSYIEPLSLRRSIKVHYVYGNNANRSNRTVNDFNESTNSYDAYNENLSNRFANEFITQRGGLSIQTRRLKYTYTLGLDVQQAGLQTKNLTADNLLNRRYTHLLPNALFTYNFGSNRTLRLTYWTRINAPTVSQLQPVPDNSNPLNIRLGNPDLTPEYTNQLMAMYNSFNASSFRSTIVVLNISQTNHKIVNSTTITNTGAQTTTYLNTNGYYSANGFMSVGRPLRAIKSNIHLNTNLNFTKGLSFINAQENQSSSFLIGQGINLSSTMSEKLDFTIGGTITYQQATYSLLKSQNTSFFSQIATADVFYQLPLNFIFTTEFTYTNNSGRSAGYNQNFVLWNVGIARQFFKNKQGELKVSVYDLLKQNRSILRNVSDNYIEDIQSGVLQQYFMLSFTYHLRKFSEISVFGSRRMESRPLNNR